MLTPMLQPISVGDDDQAIEARRRTSNLFSRIARLAFDLLKQRFRVRSLPLNTLDRELTWPSQHAPPQLTTLSPAAQAHDSGTLAPPLPRSAMEDWKWHVDWLTPWRTAAQQRRAECARQPTIQQCLVEVDPATGRERRRAVPAVPAPSPSRAPNDYDRLLDTRVLSPNHKPVGFFDWDREEIERANASLLEAAGSPVLPPVPGEGSLEAMMWPSLVDDPGLPWPPDGQGRSPTEGAGRGGRWLAGLSEDQRQAWMARFSRLPLGQQLEVSRRAARRGNWTRALEVVETQYKRSRLVPTQREIYDKARALQATARDLLRRIQVDGTEVSRDFRAAMTQDLPADNRVEVVHLLAAFLRTGDEVGPLLDNEGDEIRGQAFWLAVLRLVDEAGVSIEVRQHVVQRLLLCKREDLMTCLCEDVDDWLQDVGDREKELRGMYERSDFWRSVLGQWEAWLEAAQTTFCIVSDEEAGGMSVEEVDAVMEGKVPVRKRAQSLSEW